MDNLVEMYFPRGLKQMEMVSILACRHSMFVSGRHLRRILSKLKLHRGKGFSDFQSVVEFVEDQLKGSVTGGYRWMHLKCIQAEFVVRKDDVRLIMKALDPEGVELR